MTEKCEICGRAYQRGRIVPSWYRNQYEHVCRRPRCQAVVDDALLAIVGAREQYDPLVGSITKRHEPAQCAPIGWRGDTMAEMDMNGEDRWFLEVVRNTEL